MHGYWVCGFHRGAENGIMYGWLPYQHLSGGSRTRMRFRVFVRNRPCAASSATRRPASLTLSGAQKNSLRRVRTCSLGLVRPAHPTGPRSALWRPACVPRVRDTTRRVRALRQREARTTRFPGRQSFLHQTLCLLRGTALPAGVDQGCRRGVQAALGDDQDPRDAVHAGATGPCRHAGTPSHRDRRNLDPQRPYLSHRRQRPDPQTSDLVWRAGSQRGEHGAVL